MTVFAGEKIGVHVLSKGRTINKSYQFERIKGT